MHVNNVYTAVLRLRYVTNVHNMRHPFHSDCIFSPSHFGFLEWTTHSVCAPSLTLLHSHSAHFVRLPIRVVG